MQTTTLFRHLLSALSIALIAGATLLLSPAYAKVVPPTNSLSVELKKGQIVHLDRPAASVMIAEPNIADIEVKSPQIIYIFGKAIGETTLYALDDKDKTIYSTVVTITHNLSGLKSLARKMFPDADINFRSSDGGLVIEGHATSPQQAANIVELASSYMLEDETLVNLLDIGGSEQITLRLRIAEVARSELKQFGISLDTFFNAGNFAFGFANGRDFFDSLTGVVTTNQDVGAIYTGHNSSRWNINGIIDALEDEGFMTTLAEPNLTAMSGQAASFLAGGEFPIPLVDEDGRVTVEFREYGVSLDFTPTVMSENRISLTVAPEVSTLSQAGAVTLSGFSIPALSTRRTQTTVELASGQTFAIAGLLQNDISNNVEKFPGLGDIPMLGALFSSSRFQRNETELVILITPYVVSPTSENTLKTPLDGFIILPTSNASCSASSTRNTTTPTTPALP